MKRTARDEFGPLYMMNHGRPKDAGKSPRIKRRPAKGMVAAQMYLTDYERGEPKFSPGDAVVLWGDSSNPRCQKEYGRVIDCRWHEVLPCWDYYVAFFGFKRWPSLRKPFAEKPYVLRYLETSLRRYEGPTQPYGKGSWVLDPAVKKRGS